MSTASFVSPELIRRNMQEVLDSVQKIHKQRQKHRKKKKSDSVKDSGPEDNLQNQKSPLKEITKNKSKNNLLVEENETKTPTKQQNTLLNHFAVARKSTGDDGENSATDSLPTGEEEKPRKSNAFEIMMSARNKSIGGGTPGKSASPTAEDQEEAAEKSQNVKRKLMLQEWNEKKGGRKRKHEEDKRDDYITQQMDKRAKR